MCEGDGECVREMLFMISAPTVREMVSDGDCC